MGIRMVSTVNADLVTAPRGHERGLRRQILGLPRLPLLGVLFRRLILAVPLLVLVSGLSFFLVSVTPGDPAEQILGLNAPPGAYPKLRRQLGLDVPLYEQYWDWLRKALHGDLGASLFTDESVAHGINGRLTVTLTLIGGALLVSLLIGVAMGMYSAIRGGILGRIVDGFSLVGFALPAFWLGAVLITLFADDLGWLPATGYVGISQSPAGWLRSAVLPVLALALGGVAAVAKQAREAMLEVMGSEYVRMTWANGIAPWSIYARHAGKNVAARVLTILGLQAVGLLGGTVVVETLFGLPGLGSLAVSSSIQHDIPMVQGIVVYFTLIVVLINLVVDLAYALVNPKVRVT